MNNLTLGGIANKLNREFIGSDSLLNFLHGNVNNISFPPYNIEKVGDESYRITLALAGFKKNEINITVNNGLLTVESVRDETSDNNSIYLHKGIALRNFKRMFSLMDYVSVQSAEMSDGLLIIELERILPDNLKPKTIDIR